jgi:CheY-like chemotaxis protein
MSSEPTTLRQDHAPANGCRVLVVDDDADNVELLLELLRVEGYTVASAENGAVALALLSEGLDPDVILTDLMMPVMSGWDLYDSLKKDPRYRAIPIVITCGMAAELRGKLQVDAAFDKPVDADALLGKVAELCGR